MPYYGSQLSIHFAPSVLLALASTAATEVLGVTEGAKWDLGSLAMFNVTTFPAIICFPAPAVRTSDRVNGASNQPTAGGNKRSDAISNAWELIDHSAGGGGVDYISIADGLRSCAARGERLQRYVQEYEQAMASFAD